MNFHSYRYAFLFLVPALMLPAACKTAGEEHPAQADPSSMRPASAHGGDLQSNGTAGLTFTAPEGWIAEAPTSAMRQAQYRLPRVDGDTEDAEMVVYFFQGQGGSVQANIDRWTGQFTKPDGRPAADIAETVHRESHGIPITIVDISGTYMAAMGPMLSETKAKPGFRMLAAVAETSVGPWFFKLTGPAATVGKWEPSFQTCMDSIR